MNDEPLLKDRMLKEIERTVEDPGQAVKLRDGLVNLFNEHSRDLEMLNWTAKDRVRRLEKLLAYKRQLLENRDEVKETEKKEALGDRYNDYLAGEISSLEWVLKFVKDHSA